VLASVSVLIGEVVMLWIGTLDCCIAWVYSLPKESRSSGELDLFEGDFSTGDTGEADRLPTPDKVSMGSVAMDGLKSVDWMQLKR